MSGFGWSGFCGYGYLGPTGWIINIVLTVGILLGLTLLLVWAVRRMTHTRYSSTSLSGQSGDSGLAREMLQTRYARGEITRQDYKQMLEDIR